MRIANRWVVLLPLAVWFAVASPARAVVVQGTLLGADGQPLVGAQVSAPWDFFPGKSGPSTRTDGAGKFTLSLPEATDYWDWVQVSAPGYGAMRVEWGKVTWPLRLQKAGTLRVRLVLPDGAAAPAGLPFVIGMIDAPAQPGVRGCAELTGDAHGALGPVELQPGEYVVRPVNDPARAYAFHEIDHNMIASGQETVLPLTADKTVLVTGRIVAQDTGKGVGGLNVAVSLCLGPGARTQADGSFRMRSFVGEAWLQVYDSYDTTGWVLPADTSQRWRGQKVTVPDHDVDLGVIQVVKIPAPPRSGIG